MRLFRIPKDEKRELERLIGFHSSRDMDAMITLSSINKRMSRSALLRLIVSDWFKRQKLSIDVVIPAVLSHAYHRWEADYKVMGEEEKSLTVFKRDLKQDLASRNLPDELVTKIIKKFEEYVREHQ